MRDNTRVNVKDPGAAVDGGLWVFLVFGGPGGVGSRGCGASRPDGPSPGVFCLWSSGGKGGGGRPSSPSVGAFCCVGPLVGPYVCPAQQGSLDMCKLL